MLLAARRLSFTLVTASAVPTATCPLHHDDIQLVPGIVPDIGGQHLDDYLDSELPLRPTRDSLRHRLQLFLKLIYQQIRLASPGTTAHGSLG